MGSKYDNFWLKRLNKILSLLEEASQKGKSSKLDVSNLKSYGKRKSWYGVVEISSYDINKGEMAHASSLGKVICNNLYDQLSDKAFRLIITSNLELTAIDKNQLQRENSRKINSDENVKSITETKTSVKNDNNKTSQDIFHEITNILSQIPWKSWEYIVKKEPEWEHMYPFMKDYGYGPFATLMVVAGLNDFQLKGKAETSYWPPLENLLKSSPAPSSPAHLEKILKSFYEKERKKKLKLSRLNKFLNSNLASLLWNFDPDSASRTFLYIWRELSKTMNQDKQAKTIVFAMKCLGISLMMAGKNDFDYNKIPIPVDSRIIKFTNNIGLYSGEEEKEIQKIWSNILNNLRKVIPGITMIHIDSLVWQVASINEKELNSYFENLNALEAGKKLANLINKNYPISINGSMQKNPDTEAVSNPTKKEELNFSKDVDTICFLPCCKTKSPTGKIATPSRSITEEDLPNTWDKLQNAREEMEYCIEKNSSRTSAIYLYTGSPYDAFSSSKSSITKSIKTGNIRLVIISAGYGIVDALEPIHDYDEVMNKNAAKHWKDNNLPVIIADYLLNKNPREVYGFFAGKDNWNNPGSKYRFFFTEGVKLAIEKGLNAKAGCFYRKEGQGPKQILGALGRTFWEFLDFNYNEEYINYIATNGNKDGSVVVSFDSINKGSE